MQNGIFRGSLKINHNPLAIPSEVMHDGMVRKKTEMVIFRLQFDGDFVSTLTVGHIFNLKKYRFVPR